jgi:hypothetical protein
MSNTSIKNITLYDSSFNTNLIFTINIDYDKDITIKELKQKFIDTVFEKYGKQIDNINKIRLIMGGKMLDNDDIGIYTYNLCSLELTIRVYYKL